MDELRARATTADLLVGAHLRPNPRIALGKLLAEQGATAAMDLSDGLLGDLPKVLSASGASARIDVCSLPVLPAVRALFPDRWLDLAVRAGEDYELLATIPTGSLESLQSLAQEIGATITEIGEVVDLGGDEEPSLFVIDTDGVERRVDTGAFDHFGT
jgi:thiamine-monophosphate kinase